MFAKNLRDTALATATAGALVMGMGVGSANAIPYSVSAGNNTWHFTNWETRVTGPDQELTGLIRLDQVIDKNGNTIFGTSPQEEIVGYFKGLITKTFVEGLSAPFTFTGGEIFLYRDTTPDFNPSFDPTVGSGTTNLATESPGVVDIAPEAAGAFQAPILGGVGNGVTDGVLWAHLVFDAGISLADPLATLAGGIRPLIALDDGFGSIGLQGDGAAFLSIVDGEAMDEYDTNGFNDFFTGVKLSDMRLDNTLFVTNGPASIGMLDFDNTTNGWDTHSDDPVLLIAVAEPATLTLFGLGLLGLGGLARRRRKA